MHALSVWIDWSVETTYKIEQRFVKKKMLVRSKPSVTDGKWHVFGSFWHSSPSPDPFPKYGEGDSEAPSPSLERGLGVRNFSIGAPRN